MIPQQNMSLTAKVLLAWWIIVLIFGLFGNFSLAATAFKSGSLAAGFMFTALSVGCVVLLYRTYIYRNDFRA